MASAVSAVVAFALLPLVYAQQFEDRRYAYDTLGVSEQCFQALNSTVTGCSVILHRQTELYVMPSLDLTANSAVAIPRLLYFPPYLLERLHVSQKHRVPP